MKKIFALPLTKDSKRIVYGRYYERLQIGKVGAQTNCFANLKYLPPVAVDRTAGWWLLAARKREAVCDLRAKQGGLLPLHMSKVLSSKK